jgi:2-oxoglutarate ferredoxin oxidoreductase subunit alpha
MDAFSGFCAQLRQDPETGEQRSFIVQAEDELSAAGIVLGASWAGARAFTPTSGPGISLMSEFIGLAQYAEVPAVFFDIQRTGPSTGMPTRTQQGDLLLCAYASHGDTKHICLYPANPEECFYMAIQAFDLADRFQTPVFFVSDLDIGMNDWMIPELEWDESYRPDRGKILDADDLEKIEKFYRYVDVDGDEIPYRTLPGVHPKGSYFTRGSGHNKWGAYTEDSDEYVEVIDRIRRKIESAGHAVPEPVIETAPGATKALVTIGACDAAVREAAQEFAEDGEALSFMRIRGFPFGPEVSEFLDAHEACFIVEQNRDAQLRSMLILETEVPKKKLLSVRRYGGMPMSRQYVMEGVRAHLDGSLSPNGSVRKPATAGAETS